MRLERIKNINTAIKDIKPDNTGYKIMKDKTQILAFKITDLRKEAVQILKQDALSNNAELATPKEAVLCQKANYDCLLFGTPKALKQLATKLLLQPFGLKAIGKELQSLLQQKQLANRQIMGIINVDSNSFYTEFTDTQAIEQIYKYSELGVDIIDIGAVSTRPGSKIIESQVERERLQNIFKEIKNIHTKTQFSIDTYNKDTAKMACDSGFSIINDVSGQPENMIEILQNNKELTYILTHIQGNPSNMQEKCNYANLILDIDSFFSEKIAFLEQHECTNIILDVGIGFAKNAVQNINLIAQLEHFKRFNKPLLIGASHKSFLTKILQDNKLLQNTTSTHAPQTKAKAQLELTLLTHFVALQNGANILRVHDIEKHYEMLQLFNAFGFDNLL